MRNKESESEVWRHGGAYKKIKKRARERGAKGGRERGEMRV